MKRIQLLGRLLVAVLLGCVPLAAGRAPSSAHAAASGLAALAVLSFIACWNEFFFALIFTQINAVTLTKGTAAFVGAYETQWGEIAAATGIGMIPPMLLGFAVQR